MTVAEGYVEVTLNNHTGETFSTPTAAENRADFNPGRFFSFRSAAHYLFPPYTTPSKQLREILPWLGPGLLAARRTRSYKRTIAAISSFP